MLNLVHHARLRTADGAPPQERDDAVGTKVIAPLLNLQKGARMKRRPLGGEFLPPPISGQVGTEAAERPSVPDHGLQGLGQLALPAVAHQEVNPKLPGLLRVRPLRPAAADGDDPILSDGSYWR